MAPIVETREQHRLQKLVGGGVWLNPMLLYYSREKGIAPSEGMISLVVGDTDSPLGVRLVSTMSVGHMVADTTTLSQGFKWLCKLARRLFGPKILTQCPRPRGVMAGMRTGLRLRTSTNRAARAAPVPSHGSPASCR